jgi:hypothetical protein
MICFLAHPLPHPSQCCGSDPGSGNRCCFDFWIWDPGWKKNPAPGSGMNIPYNFSEILETVLGVKLLTIYSLMRIRIRNLFDRGSGMEKFGSGIEESG